MDALDLVFPVLGTSLWTDHHYPLYAALSRCQPWLHGAAPPAAVAALTGQYVGRGQLRLEPGRSHLRLRLAAADVPRALPLAGKTLDLLGKRIRLGVPHVEALRPVPELVAHTVTIKHATEPDGFLTVARQQLDALEVGGRVEVPCIPTGPRRGEPMRQVMRVKGAMLIAFPLRVAGLSPAESLRLQAAGLGGKRRMGGGFFLPIGSVEDSRV